MRTPFDQVSKQVVEQTLSPTGTVVTDAEMLADPQRADVWYVPDPQRTAVLRTRGLLGRIASGPCLFEPFHQSPGVDEVLDCLRKQLTFARSARGRERWRSHSVTPPVVWVLSAGRPTGALRALGMTPLAGWPRGATRLTSSAGDVSRRAVRPPAGDVSGGCVATRAGA